ncbi:hypothetical protein EMIHUDRAFT_252755 [Emiliania huxleyi CCMP1516]|uniref:Uncharacterized protein n=2 Tax=Emiliania huxleyi TaxID=2903 RepID=A0A0D3KGC0_EMIH1|nr:hypothetical protein EMIHUDRAFT_252755 [Emiliania huxleyi CCMP1516]EOD34805.1 hypothetical protein EMIHUDRAFT_252755 [Emiliania huxleyi CCMP1516]|eukprot:XP_005787234.1 hypothetical protein EMIHUDRAFT_252755 [Emiliania huxleyi CCMP1516]
MSGSVALTTAQLRELQLRREAVAALQRDRGLLQRCAEAAGLPALLPNFGLPHLIVRLPCLPAGSTCPSHAAARLLRVEDDRVEVDLLHEPTANLLRLSDASHRSGPWALTTSVAQLSSDSLADEELCALRPGALSLTLDHHAQLAELCARLAQFSVSDVRRSAATVRGAAAGRPSTASDLAPSAAASTGESGTNGDALSRAAPPPAGSPASSSDKWGSSDMWAESFPELCRLLVSGALPVEVLHNNERSWKDAPPPLRESARDEQAPLMSPAACAAHAGIAGAAAGKAACRHAPAGGGAQLAAGPGCEGRVAGERTRGLSGRGCSPFVSSASQRRLRARFDPGCDPVYSLGPPVRARVPSLRLVDPALSGRQKREHIWVWKQAVARTLRNLDAVAACAEEASSSECRDDGLRFAVGQLVVCLPYGRAGETFSRAGEWSTGRVTQLRPTRLGQQAAYQVVLRHGSYVYPPDDSDLHIREWAPEPGIAGEVQVGMEQADAAWSRAPSRRNIAAVLSAEETAALLSPVGQELLRVAAEAFDVPVEEGHAYRLLRGFICLSNVTGRHEMLLQPPQAVFDLGMALSCGEGSAILDHLVRTARSGVEAIDTWRELLHKAQLVEDEPVAGATKLVIVGCYSYHAVFFSRLNSAWPSLLAFLTQITDPAMEASHAATWRRWLLEPFDEWPAGRRNTAGVFQPGYREVAVLWLRWLLGPAARRTGFRALRAYLAHEAALTPDEHRARDDAGRFSLPRAACDALIRSVGELTEDGLMENLHDPACKACAVCSREPRSWRRRPPGDQGR